jgi:histidinol-phosphate aminotransferase
MNEPFNLVRPLMRELHPYVPGEQPKIKGLIKLNTNENPYPPSPKVMRAIRTAIDERLRLYPNPSADALREKLAKFHRCKIENIIIGNGSDELLALAVRCFVEPGATVQFFTPCYSLYPVLAAIHGAKPAAVSLAGDFGLPGDWDREAPLTFVTTPNAPTGRGYATEELEHLCRAHEGALVLDEAYADFADENAMRLALEHAHVLVARTFSKGYSLCFLRVGYMVGHPTLIAALHKIRDSYNVNGVGQIAALATLDDLPYYRKNFKRVIATRTRVTSELTKLGFEVRPSQTNFVLGRPPRFPAKVWLEKLRTKKILVRWFNHSGLEDWLRISIGTDAEMNALLRAAWRIVSGA